MEDKKRMGDSFPVNIPIQMYCVIDTTGRISPCKFKLETKEHVIETIRIQEVVSRSETNYVGIHEMQFICRALIGNKLVSFELRLNTENQRWRIFQFL